MAPFRLDQAPVLPLTGERHPLAQESTRRTSFAAASAIFCHLVLLGLWQTHRVPEAPVAPVSEEQTGAVDITVIQRQDYVVVPDGPLYGGLTPKADRFIPIPVPDFAVDLADLASLAPADLPTGIGDLGLSAGDSDGAGAEGPSGALPIDIEHDPLPNTFVPYDSPPELIRFSAPAYPDLARAAEVEAKVVLQVLVGKDGRVRDVRVLEGHPMLDPVAIDAARRSQWRPATQQHRPVAVWVQIPIQFALH